ncbi:16S rRNA (uracil(1498)-N(3))-methyltransferase [Effusibacillus dendaii]|uniref:Ribosomal RNA small subunit methyltransferase E n=1 Tax=Effusibacillus dendaii TaxID=2743772 RepID=A0A7I8DCJ5_9BACL|nr:16S rRNA (uracil(1498)-N(3))-methyltransferase [Effusibacillus dendaii]BCJ86240.1 ribosomal RNA small subunit methyltransferase E [Effusibacillus dendaii]
MQRYFISPEDIQGQQVRISGDDVKHITRVMRFEPGDLIICAAGNEVSYRVQLTDFAADAVFGEIVETLQEQSEPEVKITLVQGLPKSDKMDLIVQKGTEAGVSDFVPVETIRTIVNYDAKKEHKRRDRWQRIAKEAAEQAHRLIIPEIAEVTTLKEWLLQKSDSYDLVLLAYEGQPLSDRERQLDGESGLGDKPQILACDSLRAVLNGFPQARSIALLIGPEGGFDPQEVLLATQQGARPVTLGPRILRTETAGLVAAAIILYHYGQMGG